MERILALVFWEVDAFFTPVIDTPGRFWLSKLEGDVSGDSRWQRTTHSTHKVRNTGDDRGGVMRIGAVVAFFEAVLELMDEVLLWIKTGVCAKEEEMESNFNNNCKMDGAAGKEG
jgi:hypothetical protein